MKRRNTGKNVRSLLLTLFCTILILGAGYTGIVKGGKFLLNSEEEPQKAEYENTGSNVFLGKIEEDIQLFPWNYYEQNVILEGADISHFDFMVTEAIKEYEESFREMEAVCCGINQREIDTYYENKGTGIMDSLRICDTDYGMLYFYRDVLELEGEKFEVEFCFNDWSTLSFKCMKYQDEDLRGTKQWEDGKDKLAKMLEKNKEEMALQALFMSQIYYSYDYFERIKKGIYAVPYNDNLEEMNYLLTGDADKENKKGIMIEEKGEAEGTEEEVEMDGNIASNSAGSEEYFSYQMIELKDSILVLVEGTEGVTIGFFYDPLKCRFCGFNYFI